MEPLNVKYLNLSYREKSITGGSKAGGRNYECSDSLRHTKQQRERNNNVFVKKHFHPN